MRTIFGPVPSRRLGRSLGIDVIPPKTCSYNCVYCESGLTTHLTVKRRAFVRPEDVLAELREYFLEHPGGADALTFSSAGEPTLYEPLEELVRAVKEAYASLPLIVLTNGSLLWHPEVRRALLRADRVIPSVDAISDEAFRCVNRPHPELDNDSILDGLRAFRKEYKGQLHVEVMLVSGLNDNREELLRLSRFVEELGPDRVELNTVVRPPAQWGTTGLSARRMEECASFFPAGRTDVIGRFRRAEGQGEDPDLGGRILELVSRRPCSIEEMAASLGVPEVELRRAVMSLEADNRLTRYLFNEIEFLCSPECRR